VIERMLLVDDNSTLADLVAHAFMGDLAVTVAYNGNDALLRIQQAEAPFDIAVVDMNLPDIRGITVADEIRRVSPCTRVFLTSGNPDVIELSHGLNAHLDGFIAKPFTPSGLLAQLKQTLKTAPASEQLLTELKGLRTRVQDDTRMLKCSRRAILSSLAKLAESRDNETGLHVERVGVFSAEVARQLSYNGPYRRQITPEFVADIRLAATLHDIGKVGISDSILLKPGKLTDSEFRTMQDHTVIGARVLDTALDVLSASDSMLQMARGIVRHHHERWDGKGYPDGLKGGLIPLAARIVTVIDSYDALRSRRAYKGEFSRDETRVIMRQSLDGGQFDPHILKAFEACEDRVDEIWNRMQGLRVQPEGRTVATA